MKLVEYTGILVQEDGHVHIYLEGDKFLCLNRHDIHGARVLITIDASQAYSRSVPP